MDTVEGLPVKPSTIETIEVPKIENCERFIKAIPKPPTIHESKGSEAFYMPVSDKIEIPEINTHIKVNKFFEPF